jgi:uncharacterized membrane protein
MIPCRMSDDGSGQRFDLARTHALSDGVFAIALTLLVISINVPELSADNEDELAQALMDRSGELFSWLLSFVVIAFLWVRHHGFFGDVARLDRLLTVLNLAYLGGVAFLPYPTDVLGAYGDQPAAVGLYAATLAFIGGVGGLMGVHAARAGLLSADGAARLAAEEKVMPWWMTPAIVLVAFPLSFLIGGAAALVWAAPAVIMRLRRNPAH